MCIPAFLYPQARVSEEPASMPIPDNAKGFPVVEDAYIKQARLRLMIGLMNQRFGNQYSNETNLFNRPPPSNNQRVTNAASQQFQLSDAQIQDSGSQLGNPGTGNP
tara:strand:- start:388 stop:705 length:318 start_codon:yes stop_codon:yes gene_type:complete